MSQPYRLLATLHPKIKPSKPNICLKVPSWTPREGPRRAQDSPRWAQDGPKKGRRTTARAPKIIPGGSLGLTLGHLRPSKNYGFYNVFDIFQFSSPSDLKLPPTCKLPEPSLVDMKLELALLMPSWAQLGQFKPILKPTCYPSCCVQGFKPTTRPPKSHFASFLKVPCLQKSAKNIDFPLVF